MIRRCFSNKSPEIIGPLYTALIRPIIETNSSIWCPWLEKDIQLLDQVQHRVQSLCSTNVPFCSLSERRRRTDMRETYKLIHEQYKLHRYDILTPCNDNNLRGHSLKLYKERSRTDIRKHFFANRIVNDWNSLPETTVTASSVHSFKNRLELGANGEIPE